MSSTIVKRTGFFFAAFAFVLAGSCSPGQLRFLDDEEMMSSEDGGMSSDDSDLGPIGPKACNGGMPCPADRACWNGKCVPTRGPCCNDDECQNDTRCTVQKASGSAACGGFCVDYNDGDSDKMCIGNGFSATEFKAPADHCKWPPTGTTPAARDVVMTPVVIDLEGDGQPEIVFAPQAGTGPSRLVAIRGKDCSQVYDVAANLQGFSQIAAGDLDGDRKPEIVGLLSSATAAGGHQVAIFDGLTGNKLAQSSDAFNMTGASFDCSGPAIADLDGDGKPEIVVGAMVLRWNKPMSRIDTVWNKAASGATWGTLALINDFDGDGKPEVASGTRIFDGLSGTDKTPSKMAMSFSTGGYAAVGDFNKDTFPDLVFVQSTNGDQKVAVFDVKNNAFLMEMTGIPNGWGGPPTVADFDGDGTPDFGTAGPRNYFVFSLDCLKSPKPAKCRGSIAGVLWQSQTKDVSSGGTASSVFDFNGDGRAEVVYRDECWLRVYNGPDGKTVFARPITSGTALEMPIVADVNNDGHADLVVPSDSIQGNGYCSDQNPERETGMAHTGTTQGLFVLKDPMNRWMPSRPLWNQHTYHITNINDDGTIPAVEPPNWTRYNNYRQNVQGSISIPIPLPDATSKPGMGVDMGDCTKIWKLHATVCNRGAATIPAMLPGTFYVNDPRKPPPADPMPICTTLTTKMMMPGTCETVSCDWNNPMSGPLDLYYRANDDGKGARPQPQCKNGNDLALLVGISCRQGPG